MNGDARRVVVVGAGAMGKAWIDTVARRPDLEIVGLVDVVVDAARTAALERGLVVASFGSVDDALAALGVDLVVNVTIPQAHLEVSA
ncbi:MAG: hypothetical protein K0S49_1727, partial [Microbacterium sp.]|nr:hypothetical protein [Microbacterium sp.]